MSPERLAYFSECVRRHTNIVPSLAAEALAHIQEQAAVVERLRAPLEEFVRQVEEFVCGNWDGEDWPVAIDALTKQMEAGRAALSTPTDGSAG